MKIEQRHEWPTTAEAAIALQKQLQPQIITADQLNSTHYVAGADAGFEADGTITRAAVVILRFPDLQVVEQAIARQPTTFPYIPGLLSFREIPTILKAFEQIQTVPDLVLCDGQGIAHPRRLGIASHLGLWLNLPTIGVAKSRLTGHHEAVPDYKGAWVPLEDRGHTIGAVLRSRVNTKPLYISIGHRISLLTAIDYVLRCTPKYRLPETTRYADKLASSKAPVSQASAPSAKQMDLF